MSGYFLSLQSISSRTLLHPRVYHFHFAGGNISDWFAKLTSAFSARWATAIRSRQDASRYLPQTIAHRGYKAAWPENSMAAFKGAVEVGAHAIETDLHLSRDGVVVLSHVIDLPLSSSIRTLLFLSLPTLPKTPYSRWVEGNRIGRAWQLSSNPSPCQVSFDHLLCSTLFRLSSL